MTEPTAAPDQGAEHSKHLRSAAYSGIFSAVGVLICLFASGIFNARALGPTDRGYFALITLTLTVLCQLGALGSSLALTHFVAGRQISPVDAIRELRRPVLLQVAGVAIATLLVGQLLTMNDRAEVRFAAVLAVLGVFTAFARDFGLAMLQGCGRTTQGNYLRVVPAAFWTFGIAGVYWIAPDSLVWAIAIYIVADAASSVLIVTAARSAVRSSRDEVPRSVSRTEILTYGRRGFFSYLAPLENLHLDQFFVSLSLSATSLGYYAVGSSFNNIPRVVAVNLGLTASPIVSAAESRGASKRAAGLVFIWLTVGITVVTTILLAVATTYLIPVLFGEEFRPAIPICHVLLITGPLMAVRRIVVDVLRGAGRPVGYYAEVCGLLVFAPAALLLGSEMGAVGVAWALVAATTCNLSLLLYVEFVARPRRLRRG